MEQTCTKPALKRQREKPEVADVFRIYGKQYRSTHPVSYEQKKVMGHIQVCRSAVLGGHIEECNQCGFERNAYNSCRDRHCPKCQTLVKEQWINDRRAEVLPCGYFHLVFTLPHKLNPILQAFAKDPKWHLHGKLGFIAVLHTWSQKLMDHFHLHCLIPAGVLSFTKDSWIPANESFLFRVESLAKEFKKRYLDYLTTAYRKAQLIFPGDTEKFASPHGFSQLLQSLLEATWIAYAKRPFAGPEQVLEYLGRYTHRVAITNNRIISIDNGMVTFTYRDRQDNNEIKTMSLTADKFIRRFLLHILPRGFIRHAVALIRRLLGVNTNAEKTKETIPEMMLRLTGSDITCCPRCKKGTMTIIKKLPRLYYDSS
jgi:predicted Zn-ribbon and HTH transcriptional regulator